MRQQGRARLGLLTLILLVSAGRSEEPAATLAERLRAANFDYERRVAEATAALTQTREQIAAEKLPLVEANNDLQQRIVALETELMLRRTDLAQVEQQRQRLQVEEQELQRNLAFIRTTIEERLEGIALHLLPGERAIEGPQLIGMRAALDAKTVDPEVVAGAYRYAWQRIEARLGGHLLAGEAMAAGANQLHPGQFVLAGPEAYFVSDDGTLAGVARNREGEYPEVHTVPGWGGAEAAAVAGGGQGALPVDILGGKALQMVQAEGTWLDHLRKGGIIGYVILALGFVAMIIVGWKLLDLRQLAVDEPARVQPVLAAVREGDLAAGAGAARRLRPVTRELFATAFQHASRPKAVVEDQLYTLILRWRLHHERRLPLLAVIVTASPLLGLLGTVTGMVKTFTLITVFGTGSADKLASGISEALVTTQLGLTIAIPTLIVYGYLSQQVRKRLALLERYAVEFVGAADLRAQNETTLTSSS